jgi:hypothetical protein
MWYCNKLNLEMRVLKEELQVRKKILRDKK